MRKTLYFLTLVAVLSLSAMSARAQGTAINTTGTAAVASAMLDVQSTNQGVLVPRIATPATSITSPATGLMVYNTTTNQFNYYNGTAWTAIGSISGTAGGDLTGSYPNPTISSTAGNDIVTAVNAGTGGISGTKLAATSVSVNAFSATGRTTSNYLRGDNTWQTISSGTTLSPGSTGGQVYVTGAGGTVPTTPVTVGTDATLTAAGALTLASTGVTTGTYGGATTVPQITVDAKGRITSINNQNPFGTIATFGTISTSSSSPTVIPAADQIFYFSLPTTANGFITLPNAGLFPKGYKLYAYPSNAPAYVSNFRTPVHTFGVGPASGNSLYGESGATVTYGTSSTNFYNGLFCFAVCISDGVSAWYVVQGY